MKIASFIKKALTEECRRFFLTSKHQGKIYRILSLDGGGTRGILSGKILVDMEKQTQKSISQLFDGIAGTSTGGIIALSCSIPLSEKRVKNKFSAEETLSLYTNPEVCKKIFSVESKQKKLPNDSSKKILEFSYNSDEGWEFETNALPLRKYINTQYSADGLETILQDRFRSTTLSQMLNNVLITSLDMSNRKPVIFTSADARNDKNNDELVWKIARVTSAAPTIFNPFKLNGSILVDGGMCANNPTMCMIVDALKRGYDRHNIFCISLGTGENNPHLDNTNWGQLHIVKHIFDVMCESAAQLVDQQAQSLLRDGFYHRFQPILEKNIPLDTTDPQTIKQLEKIGDDFIKDNRTKLDKVYKQLLKIGKENNKGNV